MDIKKSDGFIKILGKSVKCHQCKSNINPKKDKLVILATCNNTPRNKDELIVMHFDCWARYVNNKITERAKVMADIAIMAEDIIDILPLLIKNLDDTNGKRKDKM